MQVLVIATLEQKNIFDVLQDLNWRHDLGLQLLWQPIPKRQDKILLDLLQKTDTPALLLEKGMPYLLHQDATKLVKTALNWQSLTGRIVQAGRKSELILQACKMDKNSVVIDGTAGFGHDGLILASACHHISLIEKNPLMALLLLFEYQHMNQNPNWQKLLAKIHIKFADITNPKIDLPKANIVYLDPMFPQGSYQSKVSKTMQSLHLLANTPSKQEESELFIQAKTHLSSDAKLIIKRPLNAEPLANIPTNHHVANNAIRFDIYHLSIS